MYASTWCAVSGFEKWFGWAEQKYLQSHVRHWSGVRWKTPSWGVAMFASEFTLKHMNMSVDQRWVMIQQQWISTSCCATQVLLKYKIKFVDRIRNFWCPFQLLPGFGISTLLAWYFGLTPCIGITSSTTHRLLCKRGLTGFNQPDYSSKNNGPYDGLNNLWQFVYFT